MVGRNAQEVPAVPTTRTEGDHQFSQGEEVMFQIALGIILAAILLKFFGII